MYKFTLFFASFRRKSYEFPLLFASFRLKSYEFITFFVSFRQKSYEFTPCFESFRLKSYEFNAVFCIIPTEFIWIYSVFLHHSDRHRMNLQRFCVSFRQKSYEFTPFFASFRQKSYEFKIGQKIWIYIVVLHHSDRNHIDLHFFLHHSDRNHINLKLFLHHSDRNHMIFYSVFCIVRTEIIMNL